LEVSTNLKSQEVIFQEREKSSDRFRKSGFRRRWTSADLVAMMF